MLKSRQWFKEQEHPCISIQLNIANQFHTLKILLSIINRKYLYYRYNKSINLQTYKHEWIKYISNESVSSQIEIICKTQVKFLTRKILTEYEKPQS